MMQKTILIAGATGATGKWLLRSLIDQDHKVKVIVRSKERLPQDLVGQNNLEIHEGNLLDMSKDELMKIVHDCDAMASCLGHNVTFKGIYGKPRKLVRDSVKKLCSIAEENDKKVRFVLMNTVGNRNNDLDEKISLKSKIVIGLLRLLLPPHPDNEQAAEFLRSSISKEHNNIDWTVVRPSGLFDDDSVSKYDIHPSPISDPIFDDGKISRINVADFMARLITDDELWEKWKGQMPVLYGSDG